MYSNKNLSMEQLDIEIKKHKENAEALENFKAKIDEALKIGIETIEGEAAKKYIEVLNMKLVADYINDLGYRIESARGNRKYIQEDIREMILKNPNTNELYKMAALVYKYNSKSVNLKGIIKLFK
jgi:hypothetical protein